MIICQIIDCENIAERSGFCATHAREARKSMSDIKKLSEKKATVKEVNQVSDKMAFALRVYTVESKLFIEGKKCAVFPDQPATEVHHKKGRATIELLLDKKHWLAVSREGHIKIELNPEWAKEKGFSASRLAKEPHTI